MVTVGGGGLISLIGAAIAGIMMLFCYIQGPGEQETSNARRRKSFFKNFKWLPIPRRGSAHPYDRIPDAPSNVNDSNDACCVDIDVCSNSWITEDSLGEPIPENMWEDAYTTKSQTVGKYPNAHDIAVAGEKYHVSTRTVEDDPVIDLEECPIVVSLSYAHFDEAFFKVLEDMVLEQEAFEKRTAEAKQRMHKERQALSEYNKKVMNEMEYENVSHDNEKTRQSPKNRQKRRSSKTDKSVERKKKPNKDYYDENYIQKK